jgi:hypothetical protein
LPGAVANGLQLDLLFVPAQKFCELPALGHIPGTTEKKQDKECYTHDFRGLEEDKNNKNA